MSDLSIDVYSDPLDGNNATKTSGWPTPKCGGKKCMYGVFMGEGTFNISFKLKKRAMFKTLFQICGPREMQSAQKVLSGYKNDDTKVKYDGKLEIPKDSVLIGKELDKVAFLRDLKSQFVGLVSNTSFACQ